MKLTPTLLKQYNLENFIDVIEDIEALDNEIIITVNRQASYKDNLNIKKQIDTNKKITIKVLDKKYIDHPNVLAIMSGKGGVGKSYVTSLLATNLAKNNKVLLLDFDVYGYSLPKYFNKYEEVYLIDNKLIPVKIEDNLDLISTQYFIKNLENEPIIWRGPKLNQLMELIINHLDFSKYDYILIDTPPSTGDIILNLNNYFKVINYFIVSTPKQIDQHVSLRTKKLGDSLGFKFKGYVINEMFYQYHNEKIYIYGKDIDKSIKSNVKAYLQINNNAYNIKQIENLLK